MLTPMSTSHLSHFIRDPLAVPSFLRTTPVSSSPELPLCGSSGVVLARSVSADRVFSSPDMGKQRSENTSRLSVSSETFKPAPVLEASMGEQQHDTLGVTGRRDGQPNSPDMGTLSSCAQRKPAHWNRIGGPGLSCWYGSRGSQRRRLDTAFPVSADPQSSARERPTAPHQYRRFGHFGVCAVCNIGCQWDSVEREQPSPCMGAT